MAFGCLRISLYDCTNCVIAFSVSYTESHSVYTEQVELTQCQQVISSTEKVFF